MHQFLETICITNGSPQHLEWHQRRVDATLKNFYPAHQHSWDLEACIDIPSEFQTGITRCRILYDAHTISIHYFHYNRQRIETLKLIDIPTGFDYGYKYADRKVLEDLFAKKDDRDDILMVREGWITDTSIANIAFKANERWYTPSMPLLAGTTWKRLVSRGILIPRPINQKEIMIFDSFKVFNALNDFDTAVEIPVSNIS